MRRFLCLLRLDGEQVMGRERAKLVEALCGPSAGSGQWLDSDCLTANVDASGGGLGPTVVRFGNWIGVGDVRLDNRSDILRLTGQDAAITDLELAIALIARDGAKAILRLLGDFAVVAWHAESRVLIAARDAFGVRTLFYREEWPFLTLSSHASLLSRAEIYNQEFFADYLVLGNDPAEPNPFLQVKTLSSGSVLTNREGSLTQTQYWFPEDFAGAPNHDLGSCVEKFLTLFREAVLVRLTGRSDTWAQLSGGLDSSAVVCMAHALAEGGQVPEGLGGTITMTDSLGESEQEFADAVLTKCRFRNERVANYWPWQDDGLAPPRTEAPTNNYPMFARDRRCCELVRELGGRILLTGQGSDQYLYGTPYYVADWLADGRWADAFRDILSRSVVERCSFWETGFRNGLVPLLPSQIRSRAMARAFRMPKWIEPSFASKYEMNKRLGAVRILDGPVGRKYTSSMVYEISHYGRYSNLTLFDETFDVRHPFLYRPLVEMCLSLPAHMCSKPLAPKGILREAMRGVLPEQVRLRTGKGGIDSRIVWSLVRERSRIDGMLRNPLLAQLGCVNPKRLAAEVDQIVNGNVTSVVPLMATLSAETWLRVRSGEWVISRECAPPRTREFA